MAFDSEFYLFIMIEIFLIGFFLILQYSSRFNARFFAGTALDRRIVDRRMIERRSGERRNSLRGVNDRRGDDRRQIARRISIN